MSEHKFPTDAAKMREVGMMIKKELPGMGFCLLVFKFNEPGVSNYISNANRQDMITSMKEAIRRFEDGQDFATEETN